MTSKLDLKQLLTDLDGVDLDTLEKTELVALVYEMLEHLGDTDSELRDGLIYPMLVRIIDADLLSDEEYIHLLETCMDERHLFHQLGERGDSVFMRSFSALLVAALMNVDIDRPFLTKNDFEGVLERAIEYIEAEMDTRGHVEGKGWAHAIAHGADMLLTLVRHPSFSNSSFLAVLEAIGACLLKDAAYADGEDKRFILIIRALQERGLADRLLESWLIGIFDKLDEKFQTDDFSYRCYRNLTNVEAFMKSLYFRFKTDGDRLHIRVLLFDRIKDLPYSKIRVNVAGHPL